MLWRSYRDKITLKVEIFGIFLISFIINFSISLNYHFFYADDWGWLGTTSKYPVTFYTRIFPQWIYNDRPLGIIFIDSEFSIFGLDYTGYRIAHVLIHCLNAVLVYLLANKVSNRFTGVLAALYFAVFYPANAAAYWVAAIFDLLGLTLSLIALILTMKKHESFRFRSSLWMGAVMLFLAIRTKEFNISVPLLLVIFLKLKYSYTYRQIMRNYWPFFVPSLILGAIYIRLYFESRNLIADTNDVYGFSPSSIPRNILFYIKSIFLFEYFSLVAIVGLSLFILTSLFYLSKSPREAGFPILFGITGFIVYLGPVLLLQGQKSNLYLYGPHAFLGISLAALITKFSPRVLKLLLILMVLAASQVIVSQKGGLVFTSNKSAYSKAVWDNSVDWIKTLRKGEKVYLSGLETYFNPFSYGPGTSIKILSNDPTLTVVLELPEDKVLEEFCRANQPKRFIAFSGVKPSDDTEKALLKCRL